MALLRFILIILLIYFGLKIILRLLAPYLLRFASRKMEKRFQNMYDDFAQQQTGYRSSNNETEGDVSIDSIPQQQRKSKNTVGEYIEYEEVE